MHLRLDLPTFLPAGEIAVFDNAYFHFANLFNLSRRGIFRVTRAKDNLRYRVCRKSLKRPEGNIISD